MTIKAGRPSANSLHKEKTLASLSDFSLKKRVNFELDADEHAKLKMYAAKEGKSIKMLLSEHVKELIK
ncbi:MAG: hypothetical protein ACRCWR_12210 [Saezia sp.]